MRALTERQREVLVRTARGLANKETARELGITESAVKKHVTVLMDRYQVPNRTALILAAVNAGEIVVRPSPA